MAREKMTGSPCEFASALTLLTQMPPKTHSSHAGPKLLKLFPPRITCTNLAKFAASAAQFDQAGVGGDSDACAASPIRTAALHGSDVHPHSWLAGPAYRRLLCAQPGAGDRLPLRAGAGNRDHADG